MESNALPFDADVERYDYGDCSEQNVPEAERLSDEICRDREQELEEEEFVNGIINMSDEAKKLRSACGRVSYYDMDVKHIGRMTGVEFRIEFLSDCKELTEHSIISAESAFSDTQIEII